MTTLARLASDAILDTAYAWLCKRRRDYPANADIWSFRWRWPEEKDRIQAELSSGHFRFGLLDRISKRDGGDIDLWSARDALVLKALTMVLSDVLPVSPRCTHIKGNGGAKAAVRQVMAALSANSFVMRTDVKSYYASIEHVALLDRLACHIKERAILNLLGQYMRRTAERGGCFWDYDKGICLGCPLSPLMGAFFLHELDERMESTGLFYVRFMDDILILSPTRWKLRAAVRAVNEVLASLRLAKHPDKTTIGRIENGFDFLGYHFGPEGLTMAKQTLVNFIDKASRLYEQERMGASAPEALGMYVQRWAGWACGGVRTAASMGQPPGNAFVVRQEATARFLRQPT